MWLTNWIEARTFEISAPIVLPPQLPLDYLKRTITRHSQQALPLPKVALEADPLGDLKA